jgi:general secretion pathway protein I
LCRFTEQSAQSDKRPEPTGFTIIEALVALVVIAVSLAAIGSVIAGNVRNTELVEERLALEQAARALLTALPDRGELAPGESRGEVADARWRMDVLPFAADFVVTDTATPWVPQDVVLRLQSRTGAVLRVDTVRLRRSAGEGR